MLLNRLERPPRGLKAAGSTPPLVASLQIPLLSNPQSATKVPAPPIPGVDHCPYLLPVFVNLTVLHLCLPERWVFAWFGSQLGPACSKHFTSLSARRKD